MLTKTFPKGKAPESWNTLAIVDLNDLGGFTDYKAINFAPPLFFNFDFNSGRIVQFVVQKRRFRN